MYLRPVLLMETVLYWRLFHYYFHLISEACCHAKFMSDTGTCSAMGTGGTCTPQKFSIWVIAIVMYANML